MAFAATAACQGTTRASARAPGTRRPENPARSRQPDRSCPAPQQLISAGGRAARHAVWRILLLRSEAPLGLHAEAMPLSAAKVGAATRPTAARPRSGEDRNGARRGCRVCCAWRRSLQWQGPSRRYWGEEGGGGEKEGRNRESEREREERASERERERARARASERESARARARE